MTSAINMSLHGHKATDLCALGDYLSCCQKLAHIERPKSASAIFDVIQIVEIAWSEILLLYCKLNSWKYVWLRLVVSKWFPSFWHASNNLITKLSHVNKTRACDESTPLVPIQPLGAMAGHSGYGLGQTQDLVKGGLENSPLKGHPSWGSPETWFPAFVRADCWLFNILEVISVLSYSNKDIFS